MNDPGEVKGRYRQFAEREMQGGTPPSSLVCRLALAVYGDDEVVGFIAAMCVTQPNSLFASVQAP